MVFYQNFADNADTRFLLICDRQTVEIADDLAAHLLVLAMGKEAVLGYKGNDALLPLFMQGIGRTRCHFIWTHAV